MNKKKKLHIAPNFSKMKMLQTKENLLMQKSIAKTLNTSVVTTNKIINKDLHLQKAKKHNVYCIMLHNVTCQHI